MLPEFMNLLRKFYLMRAAARSINLTSLADICIKTPWMCSAVFFFSFARAEFVKSYKDKNLTFMQRNVKLIAIKTIKRQTKLAGKRSIDLTEGAKLSGVRCTRMRTVSGCGSGERPECKGTAEGATRAGVRVAAPNLSGKRTEYGPITAQEHDACRKGETQNFLFCCRSFEPKSILPMGFGFLFAADKKGECNK